MQLWTQKPVLREILACSENKQVSKSTESENMQTSRAKVQKHHHALVLEIFQGTPSAGYID